MEWWKLAAGEGCPFDLPREEPNGYWDPVARMRISTLCLLRNQAYRGHCILVFDPAHVTRPDELTEDEWSTFARDAHAAVRALVKVYRPDHMNVECLGNEMPHLHWHLIPRYRDDPRWGGPIWTTSREEMHRSELSTAARSEAVAHLRAALAAGSAHGRWTGP